MFEDIHIFIRLYENDRFGDILSSVETGVNLGVKDQETTIGRSQVRLRVRPMAAESACEETGEP